MSWNSIPAWDRNRAIHFQIGLICAIGFSYFVINYESRASIYEIIQTYSERIDFVTTEVKAHSEKRIKEVLPPKQKVDVFSAKLIVTNEKLVEVKPIDASEIVTDQTLKSNTSRSDFGNGLAIVIDNKEKEPPKIFNITENMPHLSNCKNERDEESKRLCTQESMLKFIYKNLKYPTIARENKVEGTVIISFVIAANGSLKDVEIKRDIGAGCGQAAAQVISMIDEWVPGKHNELAVNVRYTIPIKFKLQ